MEETRLVLEQAKPVLALGFANLDWSEIFVIVGAMIISFATSTWLHYILRKKLRASYQAIITRDGKNLLAMLGQGIEELEILSASENQKNITDKAYSIQKLKNLILKMDQYITQEIKKLP